MSGTKYTLRSTTHIYLLHALPFQVLGEILSLSPMGNMGLISTIGQIKILVLVAYMLRQIHQYRQKYWLV